MTYYQKNSYQIAKKQVFNGKKYDSRFEAGHAMELEMMKKAGEIIDYESHVKIPLIINGYKVCSYEVDFIVYREGETEYIETKGYWFPLARLKWKLFEALFTKPGNKLTVIMQGKRRPPKAKKIKK